MDNQEFKIMIIDDNPEIHKDFRKVLTTPQSTTSNELNELHQKLFGNEQKKEKKEVLPLFSIDTAMQGEEGFKMIADAMKAGNPYALAFVDVRMPPGWDGIETIKHIWEVDKDIQAVICTAYSDYSWEQTIAELGETDNLLILKKPFDSIAVRQLASALTRKWRLMQESRSYTQSLEKSVKERTHSLQESLSITRATLESSADGIMVIDLSGKIIDYNNQLITMCRLSSKPLNNTDYKLTIKDIAKELKDPGIFLNVIKKLETNKNETNIFTLMFKDDTTFECYTQPHRLIDDIIGRVYSFRDITERVNLQQELQWQASHDALTQLPNRLLLQDRVQQALLEAKRTKSQFAILFFDLDRFKLINDSLSHAVGDQLLIELSNRIITKVREHDTFSRLGGDEFVMLITNLPDEEFFVGNFAKKLLSIIASPFYIADKELCISSSIGISLYPLDGVTYDELLKNADSAMYLAKQSGANQFQFYTKELNDKNLKRLEIESELRKAIENEELIIYYQPQVIVSSSELMAIEVMVRWNHPTKGLLLPMDFIPIAENTGLIVPISEWMLKQACQQNKKWQDEKLPAVRMTFNVHPIYFNQPNFVKLIAKIIEDTRIEPKNLELVFTENLLLNNVDAAKIITDLKNLGISIGMGDFGINCTSLNFLANLNLDRLKFDPSFLQNIQTNNGGEVVINAILTIAEKLNLEVMTEEMKNNDIKINKFQALQELYFGQPLTDTDLTTMLKDKNMITKILKNANKIIVT